MDKETNSTLKISPRDILFILFSKLHIIIGVFLIVVTVVVVKTLKTKPIYQVSASVLVKPLVDSRLQLQANRFAVAPVTLEDLNTEIKLLVSRELMARVAKDLKLIEKMKPEEPDKQGVLIKLGIKHQASPIDKAISHIRGGLQVTPVSTSQMIQIKKKGSDPIEITKIVNAILNAYIDRHIEAHKTIGSVDFYSQQISLHKIKIQQLEERLKKFQIKWSIIDSEQQNIYNLKLLHLLQESLSYIRADIAEKQIKVVSVKASLLEKGEVTFMTEEYRASETLTELLKLFMPLLVEKDRVASLYPESSAEYQDIVRQIDTFRKEIINEHRYLLNGMETDLDAMISREKTLAAEIERIKNESGLLKEKEIERNRLIWDIKLNTKNCELYMGKREEARIIKEREASRVANIFISNRASVPSVPVHPNMKTRVMLAMVAGLISGIGASFAAFYLDHTIKRPEDLERFSKVPMLSSMGTVR